MNRLNNGRLTIPKSFRERHGYTDETCFEFVEHADGSFTLKPAGANYKVNESGMKVLRKLYILIKDAMILDDTSLEILKHVVNVTDLECPECKEPLFSINGQYVCLKCKED